MMSQYPSGYGTFIVAFSPTVAQFYALSDMPSDMVTQFISGSTGFDVETFIRIPGFSPLLMNYSLLLNGLRFSPEIARRLGVEKRHVSTKNLFLYIL